MQKFSAAAKCILPYCEICEFAKACDHSKGVLMTKSQSHDGILEKNFSVLVLQCQLITLSRGFLVFNAYEGPSADKSVGGCIFYHASGCFHIQHQFGFSAVEKFSAKQSFESVCMEHVNVVQNYLTENGVFNAGAFIRHINRHQQQLRFCGISEHLQNGVAERAI